MLCGWGGFFPSLVFPVANLRRSHACLRTMGCSRPSFEDSCLVSPLPDQEVNPGYPVFLFCAHYFGYSVRPFFSPPRAFALGFWSPFLGAFEVTDALPCRCPPPPPPPPSRIAEPPSLFFSFYASRFHLKVPVSPPGGRPFVSPGFLHSDVGPRLPPPFRFPPFFFSFCLNFPYGGLGSIRFFPPFRPAPFFLPLYSGSRVFLAK